jgi:hypothetical protein
MKPRLRGGKDPCSLRKETQASAKSMENVSKSVPKMSWSSVPTVCGLHGEVTAQSAKLAEWSALSRPSGSMKCDAVPRHCVDAPFQLVPGPRILTYLPVTSAKWPKCLPAPWKSCSVAGMYTIVRRQVPTHYRIPCDSRPV